MTFAPASFVRVGLLLLAAVVLQLAAVGQITLVGSEPDLVVLVVAAVAYYGGSVCGSATGFAAGLLLDLAVGQAVGASSLVLTGVGYGVGRFRELNDPANSLLPIAVAAGATLAWVAAFAAVSFMLDIGATVSVLVVRDALVTVLLNALLALPVFAGCRKVIRRSLVVDPFEARRRQRGPREAGPIGLRGLEV